MSILRSFRPGRIPAAAILFSLTLVVAVPAVAQEVNCANEFRSGKLYFDQGKQDPALFAKAVSRFAVAAEICPEEWEYRARYGMALCEMARVYLDKVPSPTVDSADTLVSRAIEFATLAGREFEASLGTEEGMRKKNVKFVEQNRGHYWADNYNEAIELQEEEDNLPVAEFRFHLARLISPTDLRTLASEAIVKVQLGKTDEAIALVEEGLAADPANERLLQIKDSISLDVARDLASRADKDKDCASLDKALANFDGLLAKKTDDPNLIFERGLAAMTGSTLACNDDARKQALAAAAAEDFRKAASMVEPVPENEQFLLDCKFNEMQAVIAAGDAAAGLKATREYICLAPTDAVGWQLLAAELVEGGDQQGAVSALMVAKSLAGSEMPLDVAMDALKGGAKEAFDANGRPDHVFGYQETSSGNQIQTWLWLEKKKAISFVLSDKQGEVAWCD